MKPARAVKRDRRSSRSDERIFFRASTQPQENNKLATIQLRIASYFLPLYLFKDNF
jgi:hypothetical protein